MTYTREEIERGMGFFVEGRTLIIRTPKGKYITADPSDIPNVKAGFSLVGGGYLKADGKPRIDWCD